MMKFEKKSGSGFLLVWHAGVTVFLVLFVALILINIFFFAKVSKELMYAGSPENFSLKTVDKAILEEVSSGAKQRKIEFEKSLLRGPEVRDPSI